MSYATYLRNKVNSQPKILNVRNPTDASMITQKRRFQATATFFDDGQGKGSLAMDTTRPDGIPLLQHASTSFSKKSTRPADASSYTAYRGHTILEKDERIERLGCCEVEVPDSSKYKTASDVTREKLACDKSNALLEPPRFVDNTIRLSAMAPDMVTDGCDISTANHTHSQGLPYCPQRESTNQTSTIVTAPPGFQNQGVGGARIGAYYNPRSGYVENKHGNDLNVNPRRIPTKFVLDPNAPAHLKINRPTLFPIKPF